MILSETLRTRNLQNAATEVEQQIKDGLIQGAVIGTLEQEPVAFGLQNVHPHEVPMTADSRFDIASTGKIFTAACCVRLIDEGRLDPDAPFTEYLPDHVLGKNCRITIRDLATHTAGFNNDKPYMKDNWPDFYSELMKKTPVRERGVSFEYSCYDLIMLGVILNKLTGKDLDTLSRELIWAPLGMTHTTWNAPGDGPNEVEHWFPNRPAGVHNDEVCLRINIPIGSGSCFSTCGDMLKFARDMVEQKLFSPKAYKLLTTPTFTGPGNEIGESVSARRSFVWDMCAARRPEGFSEATVTHSGWTGQTIVVDAEQGYGAMIMTSRTGDWEEANRGRTRIAGLLYRK